MSYNTPLGKTIYKLKPIGDNCEFISGYAFKGKDFSDVGYPIIKIKNIQDGIVRTDVSEYIPYKIITPKLDKFKLDHNDILIAMTGQGSVGRVGKLVINIGEIAYLNQRVGKFVSDEKHLNNSYLYYIISSKGYEKLLFDAGTGSGQPNLSPNIIKSIEIPFPPYQIQKKIAHILSTLDDKIELNRKMNQTLEEMAQALFKSWFVDFDPVHAKAKCSSDEELETAACELGISKEILELFPSEFEESELGMIPKGWRVGSFEHDCKIAYGKNLPTTKLNESGYEVYGGNGVIGFYDRYLYERQQVLIGCRGAASGVVHISNPKSFVTNNSLIIELMENNELNFEYISELAKYTNFDLYRSGSAQPQITIQSINTHKFLVPNQLFTDKFKAIVESIHSKTLTNVREIQTLQKTRDTLLPKLLSGELDVSELELDLD